MSSSNQLSEASRLAELRSLGILDSSPDPAFEDLAWLASSVFDAPFAMIVFVDENRHWPKASVSRRAQSNPSNIATATATAAGQAAPHFQSFYSETVLRDDALVVNDTSIDARFWSNPLVKDGIRLQFYAGMSIRGPKGGKIGAICVLDDRARKATEDQLTALGALARQVSVLIDRERLRNVLPVEDESLRRLASIGQIAGGIAHEIKNPLSVILGQSQMAAELARTGRLSHEGLLRSLEKIDSVAMRIRHIVKGMEDLAHSRSDESQESASVRTVVDDALGFCWPRLEQAHVDFHSRVAGDLRVRCQPVQVSQAIVILINNAIDAIEVLGEGPREIELDVESDGSRIRFSVIDSGRGVPHEVRSRLFEPLFTTKPTGCGFGLSIARQIAEAHGGRVFLDEKAARTTFVLELSAC